MSSVIQPVGPEDSQVYWKRRGLVVGIVVLALLLLWVVFGRGGSEPEPVAEPVAAPTASSSPSPSASPTTSDGECSDEDVQVLVSTDSNSYPEGSLPKITLSIENTGATACKRDIGSANNEILVTSGGVDVYSSDTCNEATESTDADVKTLEPGQRANVTVEWDRTLTTAGCSGEEVAAPGSYEAVGRNGEVKSSEATFILQ